MKSSFILVFAFTSLMVNSAFAQLINKPSNVDMQANDTRKSFKSFHDRLRIGVFAVPTTPHLHDMTHGQWNRAAISPEWGQDKNKGKNRDTYATNVFTQISFNYNFGAKMNFVFNPRFTFFPMLSKDMTYPEDTGLFSFEDFLLGFQGVVYSSNDKKFNFWMRPGMRLPVSRTSRGAGNGGRGTTTHQLEIAYLPTYDFNKQWQVGIFGQFRQWVAEDAYNYGRLRIYTAPFVQYTVNDTTRIAAYYENMLENGNRWKTQNGKNPNFQDYWQNVMVGVNKDVTSKFNIFPYAAAFVNDVPFSTKSVWFGAWLSYQIK